MNARSSPSPDQVAAAKAELRGLLARRIGGMTPAEREAASAAACDALAALELFPAARTVMLYFPLKTELNVAPLAARCAAAGKRTCAPRVEWASGQLAPALVGDWDRGSIPGERGLRQPAPDAPALDPAEIDLVVVPGLGFDRACNRLGRGAGFYDRFLALSSLRAAKVGICFDCQLVEALPTRPEDVRVDAVVTDREVIR